jgi:hypothetical protein
VAQARILLVPFLTELEWRIKPLLEEWAEVASFDAPGVGDEPSAEVTPDAVVDRAVAELDRRGWDRCLIVADEFGVPSAIAVAARRRDAAAGLALGHACLHYREDGERPAIAAGVNSALEQLVTTDYRTFARAVTQSTQGAYGDDVMDGWLERVPQSLAIEVFAMLRSQQNEMNNEQALRDLDLPLLLAEHHGCLGWTRDSFHDATAAFPDARTTSTEDKPSVSPQFAAALREFCSELALV